MKVISRVRKIVRSRSASPRDKGKARITTVKRVSSETKFMPERVKPRRKSTEVKGTDIIKVKRYVHKFLIGECLLYSINASGSLMCSLAVSAPV